MSTIQFTGVQPTKYLWVSASAAPGGDGSAGKPFSTIQAAVNKAGAGTAIMVKEGTYTENVTFPRAVNGTAGAPVWLVSADGAQKAHIVSAGNNGLGTIAAGGIENLVIQGFSITGGTNGIQVSQNGNDYKDMVRNIVIKDNYIEGTVKDGIKVNGGENVTVVNNVTNKTGDQGIDLLGIVHGTVANNEVMNNTGVSAILAKGGSQDILISGNYVHNVAADGIDVGGYTSVPYRAGYDSFEAKNVTVIGNRVEAAGKRPVATLGAVDSKIVGNMLQGNPSYYTVVNIGSSSPSAAKVFQSDNITISGNMISQAFKQLNVDTGSGHVAFAGNLVGTAWSGLTGVKTGAYVAADTGFAAHSDADMAHDAPAPAVPDPVSDAIFKSYWADSVASKTVVKNGIGTDDANLMYDKSGTLTGGGGDDSYAYKGYGTIVEQANGGIDSVAASGRWFKLADNVENLKLVTGDYATLLGNAGDNAITGNSGADFLWGGGGHDRLTGGGGNDTFMLTGTDTLDRITDFAKGDVISIAASPFATFADLQAAMTQVGTSTVIALGGGKAIVLDNVDVSTLTDADFNYGTTDNPAMKDNASDKRVNVSPSSHAAWGTAASESIYGKGDSVLIGGGGNDRYFVMGPNDHIVEKPGGGNDTALVFTGAYTMEANLESAVLRVDTGGTIVGNNLANIIGGGDGNDVLKGGIGADTMIGGKGADLFVYDSFKEGGDRISDFTIGADKLDLRGLAGTGFSLSYADSGAGMQVYADHDGQHDLLATLTGVHTALTDADILR